MERILGLDVGEKTIGVAVSDEMGWTAQGVTTIMRRGGLKDMEAIVRLLGDYEAQGVVVGLPLKMDGVEGIQAEKARRFGEELGRHLGLKVPIDFWDERLSTVAAERGLLEADLSRAKRRKVINKMAAVFILQGYLDSRNRDPSRSLP